MEVGTRVIRGPDWSAGEVDGGEGHVGTVESLGRETTCEVLWDNGRRTTCRTGRGGKFDLRVFDSAPAGVQHKGTSCSACRVPDVGGALWVCSTCYTCKLCTICYGALEHDITHRFKRFDTPLSKGCLLPPRCSSLRLQAVGLFPGAVVSKGGDCSGGKVMAIEDHPSGTSVRSMVRVSRGEGQSGLYRAGHEGKVDVQCETEYPGTFYYREHLGLFKRDDGSTTNETRRLFTGGDRVCLKVSVHKLRDMQRRAGLTEHGANQDKPNFGTVKSYTPEGHVTVSFGGNIMTVPQETLKKVMLMTEGDTVRISSDLEELKQLQEGHGGFTADTAKTLGKVGVVHDVTSDGDVDVKFVGLCCRFNPACCTSAPGQSVDLLFPESDASVVTEVVHGVDVEAASVTADLDGEAVTDVVLQGKVKALSEAFMMGDYSRCLELINQEPRLRNLRFLGKPLLIHACQNGRHEFVQQLIDVGVDVNKCDTDRITPILMATVGNDCVLAGMLMKAGCDVNIAGQLDATPLHMCSMMKNGEMAKILLQHPADLRLKDANGNTPIHCALDKQQNDILKLMLNSSSQIDPTLVNSNNFNILHWATMKENYRAIEMILVKFPDTVDSPMPGTNFTALHMAANNDLTDCARVLIDKGKANINAGNIYKTTPLHLTCCHLYDSTMSVLLKKGADVNAQDEKGNTPLHYTLDESLSRQGLLGLLRMQGNNREARIQLACKLLKSGARPDIKNKEGQTALDTVKSDNVKTAVTMFIRSQSGPIASESTEQNGDSKLNKMCHNCITSRVDTRTRPCGHRFLCRKCVGSVKLCPFCKQEILGSEDGDSAEGGVQEAKKTARLFRAGDKVRLGVTLDRLKEMQREAGLSDHSVNEDMVTQGVVKNYTTDGHVTVTFGGTEVVVTEEAIQKVTLPVKEGDTVRITSDLEALSRLQAGHGGFVPDMAEALGKVGVVKKVQHNGDLVVFFGVTRWQFHRDACTPAPGQTVDQIFLQNPLSGLRGMGNPFGGSGNPSGGIGGLFSGSGNPLGGIGGLLGRSGNPLGGIGGLLAGSGNLLGGIRIEVGGIGDHLHGLGGFMRGMGNPPASGFGIGSATVEVSLNNDDEETRLDGEIVTDDGLLSKAEGMFDALLKGNISLCLTILKLDEKLKRVVRHGRTLLNLACANGLQEFAVKLLDEGVDVNLVDSQQTAPILIAVGKKDLELAKLLIERGCDVNAKGLMELTPLHMCATDDQSDMARLLLKAKADVNAKYLFGVTPLHVAIDGGWDGMLELLLSESTGFDPFTKDERGFTILHLAALKGKPKTVESILARCPGVVEATMPEHAFTPLHVAANNRHTDCVRVIINKGKANVNARSTEGWTALHLACRKLCRGTITVLLENKAEVNTQEEEGNTPLHFLLGGHGSLSASLVLGTPADQSGNEQARIQLASKLLKSGARPDIKNNAGKTALDTVQNNTVRTAVTKIISGEEVPFTDQEASGEPSMSVPCAHCLTKQVDIRLRPCGHRLLCRECVGVVEECPLCKQHVEGLDELGGGNEGDDSGTEQSCKVQ